MARRCVLFGQVDMTRPDELRAKAKELYEQVVTAARQAGTDRLKPIFIALGEKVPYDMIRLVVAHMTK